MLIIPVLIFALLVRCLIGSVVGAIVLRACCRLFNRMVDKTGSSVNAMDKPPAVPAKEDPTKPIRAKPAISDRAETSDNPYASPRTALGTAYPESPDPGEGVLQPDFGKAFLICVFGSIIQCVADLTTGATLFLFSLGPDVSQLTAYVLLQSIAMVFGFFVFTWIIKRQLPTSTGKAIRIAGMFYAIWVPFVFVIAVLFVLASLMG